MAELRHLATQWLSGRSKGRKTAGDLDEQSIRQAIAVDRARMDANGPMANTGFLDAVVDCRMMYFLENGFLLWIR